MKDPYVPHPELSASESRLLEMEREWGVSMPKPYRNFLKSDGAANIKEECGDLILEWELFPLEAPDAAEDVVRCVDFVNHGSVEFLAIGRQGNGLYVMSLREPDHGTIYFLNTHSVTYRHSPVSLTSFWTLSPCKTR